MEILEFELSVTGKATSNIELYKNSVLAQIESLKTKELITEEDFCSAEKVVRVCKEQEKKLVEAKQKAQDESASIKDVFAAIDQAQNIFRDTRLVMEKQIKTEKVNRKQAIIDQALKDYETFILVTLKRYGFDKLPTSDCTEKFLAATKGKKNIDSMQTAVNESLEKTKANLDVFASRKFSNLQIIKARVEQILFPDSDQLSDLSPDILMIEIDNREQENEEKLEKIRIEAEEKAEQKIKDQAAQKKIDDLKKEQEVVQLAPKKEEPKPIDPENTAPEEEIKRDPLPRSQGFPPQSDSPIRTEFHKFRITVDSSYEFESTIEGAKLQASALKDKFNSGVRLIRL